MTATIIIVLLTTVAIALAAAWLLVRGERDAVRLKLGLVQEESAHLKREMEEQKGEAAALLSHTVNKQREFFTSELEKVKKPCRPARFKLEGGLSPELVEQTLAGTGSTPVMRAVLSHVSGKIIRATDAATDRPQVELHLADRTIAPYTAEDRLYDSGSAGGFAELLAELQEMSAAKEEKSAA